MMQQRVFIVIAITFLALLGFGHAEAAKIGPVQPVYASACPVSERLSVQNDRITVPERYLRLVQQYSASEGVDPIIFFSLIWKESDFCQRVRSSTGAIGLTQLMPATARELGVDPTDVHQNVAGGARYLARMKRQFGSYELALAAYNAGPGRVRQWGGVPPIPETQNYIAVIQQRTAHPALLSLRLPQP